jgi:hypothetical protein
LLLDLEKTLARQEVYSSAYARFIPKHLQLPLEKAN